MGEDIDTVYAWINIQNGSNCNPAGGGLQTGQKFYWANPTSQAVTVNNCGGFCTASSYSVPAPQTGQQYGLKEATLLTNPTVWTFSETPNQWNAPGLPHIGNPPWPTPMDDIEDEDQEEVA
ncbi:MAG TPA: hypothetical protein VI386_09835 [Candidatus Sulfotelmatobacter sp.]